MDKQIQIYARTTTILLSVKTLALESRNITAYSAFLNIQFHNEIVFHNNLTFSKFPISIFTYKAIFHESPKLILNKVNITIALCLKCT